MKTSLLLQQLFLKLSSFRESSLCMDLAFTSTIFLKFSSFSVSSSGKGLTFALIAFLKTHIFWSLILNQGLYLCFNRFSQNLHLSKPHPRARTSPFLQWFFLKLQSFSASFSRKDTASASKVFLKAFIFYYLVLKHGPHLYF